MIKVPARFTYRLKVKLAQALVRRFPRRLLYFAYIYVVAHSGVAPQDRHFEALDAYMKGYEYLKRACTSGGCVIKCM